MIKLSQIIRGQKKMQGENCYKRRMKNGAGFILSGFLFAAVLLTAGCSSEIPVVSSVTQYDVFSVGSEKCTFEEAKIILLQYQKESASLYGIDLWNQDYGAPESLEQYIKDLTASQLAEVYTLDVIASEQEVELTEDEKALTETAGQEYIGGLSEEELEYLGIDEKTAAGLFERYLLAEKLYTSLTESVSQEVSDDEARVMEMEQICVSDAETAADLLTQLESGADFDSLAESYSESDTTSLSVSRSTYDDEVTEILFAMDTGDCSDVIEMDGQYYIFYCTNYFNEELTENNKENVVSQRMEDAVISAYSSYTEQLDSVLNEDVWGEVTVDTGLELNGASFEEIYDSYFAQ
ncbi:MAG: peptidyl-prolyl cis-trans isomerase [Lachnospiraceae bacterium]|nr:peptidyl-prolyl cis-trans isomerase [Lachnospiraceae bacterium]